MDLLNQLSANQQDLRAIDTQLEADAFLEKVASQFDTAGKIFVTMLTMVNEIRNAKNSEIGSKNRKNLGGKANASAISRFWGQIKPTSRTGTRS